MKLYKDRYFLVLSFLAGLVSFVLYDITKAPTVSFWDCGEFIATSYILGIPHPPGNPLFILIGRLFTMIPIASQIAVRVNLISVLSSAAAVFMAFWLILRLAIGSRREIPGGLARIGLGIGALAGSLIMAFSYTFWSNAVEAEVYGLAMLFMVVITYLALLWAQDQDSRPKDQYLIAISYLLWLSLAIHMTAFIITVPLVLYLAYVDYRRSRLERWPVWVIMTLFILYAVPIQTQILSIFGINISAHELVSTFILIAVAFAASVVMMLAAHRRKLENARIWTLAVLVMVFAGIGYSSQAYIPVRAVEKPRINENDPSTWGRFNDFLERKQYGQESMITRMFRRRASWQNQFISSPSFGLLRLLSEQYTSPDAKLTIFERKMPDKSPSFSFSLYLWIIYLLFLGIGGFSEAIRRGPPEGLFIVFTALLCTVGLVFYLNFSDGAYNKLIAPIAEVRDRDYFYTPGFMYFAILIGVGLSAFLEWLAQKTADATTVGKKRWFRTVLAGALAVAILLPVHTAFANFDHNDRRGNFFPYDYARNLLESCDKNAILFTNGDNDTFPLWFAQEVEKNRTDVRVVNLSLLNTPWYIHQLKDQLNVPIKLSYDEIEKIHPMRIQGQQGIWRVQDQMVREIIVNSQKNNWVPPVYFAMTVPSDNMLGLEDHLMMEGMAHRVVESTGKNKVNPSVGARIFGNLANFRGITDPCVRKDENEVRLISNYVAAIFEVADTYFNSGHPDSAIAMAEKAVALQPSPELWQTRAYLARMYASTDQFSKIDSLAAKSDSVLGEKICLAVAQDLMANNDFRRGETVLKLTLSRYPPSFTALNNLVALNYQRGDTAIVDSLIARFRENNYNNKDMLASLDDMVKRLQQMPGGVPRGK